jgi:hypothetical protein
MPACLQSRRNVLLYAGGAVAAVAGLTALLNGGGSDGFGEVDARERASIGESFEPAGGVQQSL